MDQIKRVSLAPESNPPFDFNDPEYKKSLPPEESYFYFPKGEEIIILNESNPFKSLRKIFYNAKYYQYEIQKLAEFNQLIKSNNLTLPDFCQDYFLLAFIYGEGGQLEKSLERLREYLKFSNTIFPVKIQPRSKVFEILNTGFLYVYGRDNRYRPILVGQCRIFKDICDNYSYEEFLEACSFLSQFVVNHMLLPGQFETWNMIVNMKEIGLLSFPKKLGKLLEHLSKNFLCRLNKCYKNRIIIFRRSNQKKN